MTRALILPLLLLCACFDEPVDKVVTPVTTVANDEGEPDESSTSSRPAGTSSDGVSSSEESSSAGETSPFDPCPEWCTGGCDRVQGVYTLCRCFNDLSCEDGTECEGESTEPPNPVVGYCM